jgi:hypothetical protein
VIRCLLWSLLALLLVPAAVRGQSPAGPVSRADVAVSTGWFAADRSTDMTMISNSDVWMLLHLYENLTGRKLV